MYQIFAEKENGEIFECFTWTGLPEAGIQRAKKDAEDFGVECVNFWYEKIENVA